MNYYKVSIIVPIYNVEQFLKQCVDSLLNQTLQEIEVILVDDGSPDSCPKICEEYKQKDKRVKVIHKSNGGLSDARNAGIKMAEGQYVAFVDSDDYVDLQMFEKLYDEAKGKNLDVCYCDYNFDMGGKIRSACKQKEELFIDGKKDAEKFLLDMVGTEPQFPSDVKYLVSVWHGIYKRSIIEQNSISFESERLYPSEDLLFHIDFLSQCSKIGYLKECMYYWRYNPKSLSRTYTTQKFNKYIDLLIRTKEKLDKHFTEEIYRLHYQRCIYSFFRSIVKYEVLSCSEPHPLRRIKRRCQHPLMKSIYESYPINQMVWKHRIFFYGMKWGIAPLLYAMCWLENRINKNV